MDESQVIDEVGAVETPVLQEKMLSQSEVNKIVGRAKAEAEQKARRQAEEEFQRQMEAVNQGQQQRVAAGNQQVDADAIFQQVQERFNNEMQQRQMQQELSNVAQNYLAKIEQAKGNYEDFDEVTKDFDATAFPQLVYLVAGMENAGDVIYDLAKNPVKLAAIDRLAEKNPRQAHAELMKLAASISSNKQAQAEASGQEVNAPLDRLQPSRVSGSNGKPSIRDLRSQPWLRG